MDRLVVRHCYVLARAIGIGGMVGVLTGCGQRLEFDRLQSAEVRSARSAAPEVVVDSASKQLPAYNSQAPATEGTPSYIPMPKVHGKAEKRQMAVASGRTASSSDLNPDIYIQNEYIGGAGSRDRIEKLIASGVMVDGKQVKLDSFSRTYQQTFPIPSGCALGIVAETERAKIVQEGDHTFLQVGLQATQSERPQRPPLNVALVIDRSGSMSEDEKLANARRAALKLVSELRPEDTFALIAFDDRAQTLIPAQRALNRHKIEAAISALKPGGGTNIFAGLTLGYREVAKHTRPEGVNRVILLSDGEVTAGIKDPQAFHRLVASEVESDIQTTSVGLGLEFNEQLMLAIATDGRGNYHFIKNGADTQSVFARELDELSHVVAKAVRLRINLAPGIGLVRVLGAKTLDANEAGAAKAEERRIDARVAEELGITSDRQHEKDEPGIKLLIPDFYRGDNHIVMLELSVPPGVGKRRVADVFLKYKDLTTSRNCRQKTMAEIEYTPNRAEMIASVRRSVKKNLLGLQTGEALSDAGRLIAAGDIAEAIKRVDERMVVLGVAAKAWNDRDLDHDGALLSRYKTVIAGMGRQPAQAELGQYLSRSLTYAGYKLTR